MRRRISLYIAEKKVDLGDQEVILFNYAMSDLNNPTIVRNSYSQQLTLDGTPNNNTIFGDMWRSDRVTMYGSSASGVHFNASVKTPFIIFNEMNEVLESGYAKLDEIVDRGYKTQYKVSLYGGLGAFFYALSYTSEGNKRTLADLKYTGETAGEDELNFVMNAASVKAAWAGIGEDGKWGILNFAPAYNGLPSGLFDANKAIFKPDASMIAAGYQTKNGFSLCTMPEKYTEWETFDLRSYLQRPVIRMKAILEAISQPWNNGGYNVVFDEDIATEDNVYWERTWITLPMLQNITLNVQTRNVTLNLVKGSNNIPDGGETATNYEINVSLLPSLSLESSHANIFMHCDVETETESNHYLNWMEIVITAYDADGYQVAQRVVSCSDSSDPDIQPIDFVGSFDSEGNWRSEPVNVSIDGQGITRVTIAASLKGTSWGGNPLPANPDIVWFNESNYDSNEGADESLTIESASGVYTTSKEARSGSTITKKMLLSSDRTPADYLLSYCKIFGYVFSYDKVTKTITILKRENFYKDETIDLTRRIVKGSESVLPYVYDSKWYDFVMRYDKGEYVNYYRNIYHKPFGLARVDTGYDFNADVKDVMESVLFNGAVNTWDVGKNYVAITKYGVKYPSIWQDGGKYQLFQGEQVVELNLPVPSINGGFNYSWLNFRKGYDAWEKVQFHESEKKSFDERDTLLFYTTSVGGSRYSITDDNGIMMNLNNNTPCWILNARDYDDDAKVNLLPRFSRYIYEDTDLVQNSLDFGNPEELPLPGEVEFMENADLYSFAWKNYISDIYDDDTRILRCKVNFGGMQVNESLFGKFYFYDNALWVLNRIINHSITTWDDTECEFVKVKNKSNYTQGGDPPTPPTPPAPEDDYLYADQNVIQMIKGGGTALLNVRSNVGWTISEDVDWMTLSKSSGTGNDSVIVTITANASTSSRSAYITLKSSDETITFSIYVNQSAGEPAPGDITVSPTSIDCDMRGYAGYLQITTPGAWTIESPNLVNGSIDDSHWVEVQHKSGTGSMNVQVWIWGGNRAPTPGTSSITVRSGSNFVTIPINKHE